MRVAAIIPVKRFGGAKQRLATALDAAPRRRLAEAMVDDVLSAAAACRALERMIVVTGEHVVAQAARDRGAEVLDDAEDAGHSAAAQRGVARALELGMDAAALLPGDCPLLDPTELDAALGRLAPDQVAIVPDRHGSGTNALLLAPPDAIEPAFGEGSRARHEKLARSAGVRGRVETLASLAPDVDTPADLEAVAELLHERTERAPRTAAVLRTLTHARPLPPRSSVPRDWGRA